MINKPLYFLTMICTLCVCVPVRTQETKRQPDLQTADNTFFDPTRKEKKNEVYRFGVEYRVEAGYIQANQRTRNYSYPDMYLHGVNVGGTFTFLLPLRFGVQTGVFYSFTYGKMEQHWRSMDRPSVQTEYIRHHIAEHNLAIPIRCYYTIPLWKQLNMFFYTGPQLNIGLAEQDNTELHLSGGTQQWLQEQGISTVAYDRFSAGELYRINILYGLGGGFEWDRYRLQAGYDFGLNNLVKQKKVPNQQMWEWSWYVSFGYRF